jgi:nucleoside-diphosphate-sugar epimerase
MTPTEMWSGRRVLITGGAGFIGSHLTERLVSLGATVRVVDNLERGRLEYLRPVESRIEFRKDDLRTAEACDRACQDIDFVFHLASKVGGIKYYLIRPGEVILDNTLIDTHMLRAALEAGIGRYLYASSAHVYPIELQGSPEAALIREEQAIPAHPELSYGWAKLLGEKQIEYAVEQGTELRAAIVRIIGAFGPHQDVELETGSAIPVFTRRAIEYPRRQPFVVLGSGEETRSFCYVSDIVEGFLAAAAQLEHNQLVGPLNLGNEDRISIRDLALEIIRISGKDIQITWNSSHPTVIWGQALDCSKTTETLGWKPVISLSEGLRRVYAHLEARLAEAQAVEPAAAATA